MHTSLLSRLLLALIALLPACRSGSAPSAPPPRSLRPDVAAAIQDVVLALGPDVRAAVCCTTPGGEVLYAHRAEAPMPCASSIKAAFLIELFDAFAADLEQRLPGTADLLRDAGHPAVRHFTARQRETAIAALGDATVRRIGEVMITGRGVDNATYNLAANLVIAHSGGPAEMTARLHARAPSWRGLAVRRYMLADRSAHGDNEATAAALAAVHAMLARGDVPGASPAAIAAACAVLARTTNTDGSRLLWKGGSLDSLPLTRVRAGSRCDGERDLAFAVLLASDVTGQDLPSVTGERLAAAATQIEQVLLEGLR